MTKTKKQLRAEAVERLKNCVAARFDAESIVIALASGRRGQSDWSLECDKLIYLLTDDELPQGDALGWLRKWIAGHDPQLRGHGLAGLETIANMIERDYVRRDAIEEVMDNDRALVEENAKLASELEAAKLQIGQSDAPKSEETPENHAPKREIRDFDVSERYATAFKWLDRLHYGEREAEDSREQLEADVRDVCWGRNIYRFDSQKRYLKEHGLDVREDIVTTNYEGHVLVNVIMHLLDRQAAITERETTKRHELFCETCEAESDKQIAELTAERDNWKANCEDWEKYARAAENACYETMLEREDYRKKFGKCLDYADAIHALMDEIDEGLA